MKFRIVDLTSAETVKVRGFPSYTQIRVQEYIEIGANEVGIILGKHTLHEKGVGTFGGIANPLWKGHLTIEMISWGEFEIQRNQGIAHLLVIGE